ncbi:MAG: bifunctional riboflavin kinase/FAD synthetase [Candidatus Margulisiibacteriota bacterium]
MKIIKDLRKFKEKGSVAALGTFDGLHLGHKKVILAAARFAKRKKLPCVVVTFDPHPKSVVNPLRKPLLLTTVDERAGLVKKLGADMLAVIRFDKKLENTSYRDFAKKVLAQVFKSKAVFIGQDYAFGRGREGDPYKLRKLGGSLGFKVFPVADKELGGEPVKSTLIRTLLKEGEFARAMRLLGHPYMVQGTVVKGYGRGRELGYPTANIKTGKEKLIPKSGVYAGEAEVFGERYLCAVNIGTRPTFNGKGVAVEAYLIGFRKDITGENISLFLTKRLRDEKKFKTVKELIEVIKRDVARASLRGPRARSRGTKQSHSTK